MLRQNQMASGRRSTPVIAPALKTQLQKVEANGLIRVRRSFFLELNCKNCRVEQMIEK